MPRVARKTRTRSHLGRCFFELDSLPQAEITGQDMLDTIALGVLIFTAISLLFGAIAISRIPYRMARERNHPHQDAIAYGGWFSLFTLHAVWPLLCLWAAAYRQEPQPVFGHISEDTAINDKADLAADDSQVDADITDSVTLLGHRYEVLDDRIERIEKAILAASDAA